MREIGPNDVLAFVLEIALCVALGMWGYALGGWYGVFVAVAIVIVLWGLFASPKAPRRLPMPWILIFKSVLFAIGTVALLVLAMPVWALVFGVFSVVHLAFAARAGTV